MTWVFMVVAIVGAMGSFDAENKYADRCMSVFMFSTIAAVVLRLCGG